MIANLKRNKTEFDIFINLLMKKGKKEKALNLFLKILYILKTKFNCKEPYFLFLKGLYKVMPKLRLVRRSINRRKFMYVPLVIHKHIAIGLASKWILFYAKLRSEKSHALNIALELVDASSSKGGAFLKKRRYNFLLIKSKGNLKNFLKKNY